jgi:hypothetical protein
MVAVQDLRASKLTNVAKISRRPLRYLNTCRFRARRGREWIEAQSKKELDRRNRSEPAARHAEVRARQENLGVGIGVFIGAVVAEIREVLLR